MRRDGDECKMAGSEDHDRLPTSAPDAPFVGQAGRYLDPLAADIRLVTQRGPREQRGRTVAHRQHEGNTMSADEEDGDDDKVIITVPADMQAGVWANWARINEGDNAFA
jgi:hypothetical protein